MDFKSYYIQNASVRISKVKQLSFLGQVKTLESRNKGILFDIIRASIHDGPGIRTTVFLKGCHLRCIWCHNPESWYSEPQLFFNKDKCLDCFACVDVCPTGVHVVIENRHAVKFELCIACGKCIGACNYDALRIIGTKYDVDSIFEEIKQDKDFYDMSGGGVTLSGGEPLMQMNITLKLLKKCREAGIHTCVETCGHVPQKNYKAVMSYVDVFLFDYKCTDSGRHKELTGVTNELILSNLDYLYNSGVNIILRCPMVPGLNDTMDHFKAITAISNKYPLIKSIEILPFHNMGIPKGLGMGLPMDLIDKKTVTQDKKDEWLEKLNKLGCKNVKI